MILKKITNQKLHDNMDKECELKISCGSWIIIGIDFIEINLFSFFPTSFFFVFNFSKIFSSQKSKIKSAKMFIKINKKMDSISINTYTHTTLPCVIIGLEFQTNSTLYLLSEIITTNLNAVFKARF